MANLKKYDYGFLDNNFNDFYNMIDSFFNGNDRRSSLVNNTTFKVDIKEDDESYKVIAEMPGFTKDDINIEIDDDRLTLSAEKTEEKDDSNNEERYIHRERRSSKMTRTMNFENIDSENIEANLSDGLLEIKLPKLNKDKSKKTIEIK